MICFYHNDADGRCAGAIVKKYIDENFSNTIQKYVEVNYSQFTDEFILSQIVKGEVVYVVDFHFSPEITNEMCKITSKIRVFDHHKTGAEIIAQYPKEVECYCDPGSEFAGCELVWNYLYPTTPMPRVVELIADRDKWAWKYGDETAQFNEGLKLYSHQPVDKIWEDLLYEGIKEVLTRIQISDKGKICLKYRDCICKEFRNNWSFEAEIEGHKCYVMNLFFGSHITSEMFAEKLEEYDVCAGIVFKNGTWKISLRSNGKIDVSEIVKKLGGGGHAGAAGADGLKELPFKIMREIK